MNVVEKMKLRIFFLKMRDFELIWKKKLCSPFGCYCLINAAQLPNDFTFPTLICTLFQMRRVTNINPVIWVNLPFTNALTEHFLQVNVSFMSLRRSAFNKENDFDWALKSYKELYLRKWSLSKMHPIKKRIPSKMHPIAYVVVRNRLDTITYIPVWRMNVLDI